MAQATLTIASKNYGSWSLRGWLLCKMAGLEFDEQVVSARRSLDARRTPAAVAVVPGALPDPRRRQGLGHAGDRRISRRNHAGGRACCPKDRAARAHCRSICGEMHSGFSNLRSALPMNLKAHYPGFKFWAGARSRHRAHHRDLARMPERITAGRSCSARSPCLADAMYAPVCTRFLTYDVKLDPSLRRLLPDRHGDAGDAGVDRRREGGARRARRARRGVLESYDGACRPASAHDRRGYQAMAVLQRQGGSARRCFSGQRVDVPAGGISGAFDPKPTSAAICSKAGRTRGRHRACGPLAAMSNCPGGKTGE